MRRTTETVPSQSSPAGTWLGSELYVAHIDLEAADLAQVALTSPFFQLLPAAGHGRAYEVLGMTGEWHPGRVFGSDQSLILTYGLDLSDTMATVGPISQPMKLQAGVDFPILVPQPFTIAVVASALFTPLDSIENMPIGLVATQPFSDPGSLVEGTVSEGEQQGTGYTAGDSVEVGDGGAIVHVDSVDGDGAVLTYHVTDGGDPVYIVGGTYSDAHSGEEGHGTGFTINPTVIDGPPVTGHLHLEIFYRKTQLHLEDA